MNSFVRRCLSGTAILAAVIAVGCGQKVLDFRNVEISNGKIYSRGANTPFTGSVTNVPMSTIRVAAIRPMIESLTNVTKEQIYSQVFLASALGAVMGSSQGGLMCDVALDEGLLDGDVKCSVQNTPVFQVAFSKGTMDGKLVMSDPRNGKTAAEATMKQGRLHGKSAIYDASTGKVLNAAHWENGVTNGPEQMWDREGRLVYKATFVNGKYEGEVVQYDANGQVKLTTIYSAGVLKRTLRPGVSDAQNCVEDKLQTFRAYYGDRLAAPTEKWLAECGGGTPSAAAAPIAEPAVAPTASSCTDAWAAAYRKERGEDAMVKRDQLDEWAAWCRQGKKPA